MHVIEIAVGVAERQSRQEAMLAARLIMARLIDRGLAMEIRVVGRDEHGFCRCVGRSGKDVDIDRFFASLLASPPGQEELPSIAADAVDAPDNPLRRLRRASALPVCQRCRCKTRNCEGKQDRKSCPAEYGLGQFRSRRLAVAPRDGSIQFGRNRDALPFSCDCACPYLNTGITCRALALLRPRRGHARAECRERGDVLADGAVARVERHRNAGVDALERHRLLAHIDHLLVSQGRLDVIAPGNAAEEASPAPVDRDRDAARGLRHVADRGQRLHHLSQSGDRVQPDDDGGIRGLDDLRCPGEPGERQVDQDQVVARRRDAEQCVERRDVEIAVLELGARRSNDVEPAAVVADEDVEQLVIEPLGIGGDLLDLQARLDVEIIAGLAGLEIEVDETDVAPARRLVDLELDGGFDQQRRIAHAARARYERDCHGPLPGRAGLGLDRRLRVAPPDDLENLLRVGIDRHPVRRSGAAQRLVVADRDVLVEQDDEQPVPIARGEIGQPRECLPIAARLRRQNVDLAARLACAGYDLIHAGHRHEVGKRALQPMRERAAALGIGAPQKDRHARVILSLSCVCACPCRKAWCPFSRDMR